MKAGRLEARPHGLTAAKPTPPAMSFSPPSAAPHHRKQPAGTDENRGGRGLGYGGK